MTGWLSLTPSFVHEAYSHPYVPEMQAHHSVPPLQPTIMPPPPMVFMPPPPMAFMPPPKADNPREIRNKAEKQRRDKLNQSIAELASLVPPVVHSTKKIDKTGVLRYTAHYLRAHQYVFRSSPLRSPQFSHSSAQALLSLMNGFLLSTTYKGLIVVVSQNINEYLGYTELELLGKSIFPIVHEDDHQLLRDQLMPRSQALGHQGELLLPNDLQGRKKAAKALANEKRRFMIRLLKLSQRSEPSRYVTCHVEGSFRMSDQALQGHNRCCQMVRRARARGDNPCSSGNDVVFIGVVRPCMESFINESVLESYQMEYRTRHSIDGEIIECEQRIALVTGYMMSEVSGVNAMNFIHRDEVRWVIIALKEMYSQNQLYGESCYRLMTKNSQFIYMRTRGRLDVDASSRSVTSFVCTNTVVCEEEGKHLIRMMKERFTLQASYEGHLLEDIKESSDSQAVEDPRQLEKEILNMVTTLPSVDETSSPDMSPSDGEPTQKLALIPPEKKRIVSAIEKIYTVIKTIPKQPSFEEIDPEIYEDNPHMYEEKLPVDEIIQPFEEITDAITPTRSEVSNLPQFNPYFQTQSSSEAENSEVYSPVPSSDFDSVMTDSREEMASVMEIEYIEDMEFEIYSTNECEESNNPLPGQQEVAGSILPNEGVKHPICEDEKITSKKKTVVKSTAANDSASDHNAPTLETFFNDDVMMGQIQSAMEALNEMEPGFTDFLSTREVEDILGPNQSETT